MTQINWQYQVNNRSGGYIVTNTDWNDFAGNFRALVDQTTGSGTTDNVAMPIGIDLVNHKVFISDPTSTVACTPEAANNTATAQFQVSANSQDAAVAITAAHDTEATSAHLMFRKADGSQASPALVDDNAVLGKITFSGYDGNSWATGAVIQALADGAPADGDMPTELVFQVTPDGGSETPATAVTISPDKTVTFAGAVTEKDDTPVLTVADTGNNYAQDDVQCEIHLAGRYHSGTADPLADAYSDAKIQLFKDNSDGSGGSGLSFWTSADGAGGLTKKLEIDKDGRVNIEGQMRLANIDSVNHDDASLMCGGNYDVTPDAHWNAQFVVDGNGFAGGIAMDGDAMWVGHNATTRALYFATNETMRTNISGASGYLYHGTTGGADFPGTDGFMSIKSGDRVALAFYRQNSTSTTDLVYGLSDHSSTGTKHFQIECDGDVQNTYGNYTTLSDERLKEAITTPRDYYEDLRKLEVKNYKLCKAIKIDYDEDENGEIDLETKKVSLVDTDLESRKKLLGLVAQEAEKIFPSLVKTGDDGYKSVSMTLLIPMLLQMCQKMADKIEALEGG